MDFQLIKEKLNEIGIYRVSSDLYYQPNSKGFVKSPETTDKTPSCKLYSESNTYCDFANGNKGGDIISFVAYTRRLNNFEALKLLAEYYRIDTNDGKSEEERKRLVQKLKYERNQKRQRKKDFYRSLYGLIDKLKNDEEKLKNGIKSLAPFCDDWCKHINELQIISYKLDILCAADMYTYRRMKPKPSNGIGSDRPLWLLDCIEILKEYGYFTPTQEEIAEIKEQYKFELTERKTGVDRVCKVDW